MREALTEAMKGDTLHFIEAVIPRDDCTQPLKRLGEQLGKQRDPAKRGAA